MNEEAQKVAERYERRKHNESVSKNSNNVLFSEYMQKERELIYQNIIHRKFKTVDQISVLEIGAGSGGNIPFFKNLSLEWKNIHANELLPDRFKVLKENFPFVKVHEGDALEIPENLNATFDIVFQSTVFTSILDFGFKGKLANKMWELVKPGGIILWYDFAYDNPRNKDVKGIDKKEIIELFKESNNIRFQKVTLAPPIGRRVGKMYPFFNALPFLRTHLIAVIEKK